QQLADSAAFSTATQVARSFNFYAYTNRANISGLVAAASLHGYMSLASSVPSMFKAAEYNFYIMAMEEIGWCCACPWCSCVQHCIEAIRDIRTARRYRREANSHANDVKDLDKTFVKVMKALDYHVRHIALQQRAMMLWTIDTLRNDKVTNKLLSAYAEGAKAAGANLGIASGVGALNVAEYWSAGLTQGAAVLTGDKAKKRAKWLGTEIANGTRYKKFVNKRNLGTVLLGIFPTTLLDLTYGIPRPGLSFPIAVKGESRVIEKGTSVEGQIGSNQHGPEGKAIGAADKGLIFSYRWHALSVLPYYARLGSGKDDGEHKCKHISCCDDQSQHRFQCLGADDIATHNCFTIFNLSKEAKDDFNQPRIYAAIEQDLRSTRGVRNGKLPWEINQSGKVTYDFGQVGKGEVQVSDTKNGLAISKALVYYHHPDWQNSKNGWKEPPNFFNPYWRAKLQPFRNVAEFSKVVVATGRTDLTTALLGGGLTGSLPLP
ncbi:MAG: hypothetical protein D6806_05710, partial [Deltaproteobacteria bacterium]